MCYRTADCGSGRGQGVRDESLRGGDPVPQGGGVGRQADRISLGRGAETEAAGNGEAVKAGGSTTPAPQNRAHWGPGSAVTVQRSEEPCALQLIIIYRSGSPS